MQAERVLFTSQLCLGGQMREGAGAAGVRGAEVADVRRFRPDKGLQGRSGCISHPRNQTWALSWSWCVGQGLGQGREA